MFGRSQIALDKGESDHTGEALGGLLEPAEDAAALLQPADQPLDDVAVTIHLLVESHGPGLVIFVGFRWDHRRDIQVQQVIIDPRGAIVLLGRRGDSSDRLTVEIEQMFIRTDHHRVECRRFVRLTGGQLKVQRMARPIAQHVDFADQTAAAATECVVRRFFGIPCFPPPAAHLCARTAVPSMHHSLSLISTSPYSRRKTATSVPSPFHLSNISHAVAHGPNPSGRSRHGEAVLRIQRMPSSTYRRSRGGRPIRLRGGNRSAIRDHCSSVSRCRSITSPFEGSVLLHHRPETDLSDRL